MLKVDEDTRETTASLLDRAKQLSVKVSSATSFFMPFLLSLDEEDIKKIHIRRRTVSIILKRIYSILFVTKQHVLSKEQEEVLITIR